MEWKKTSSMSNVNSNGCTAAHYQWAGIEIDAFTFISNDNESSNGARLSVMGVISNAFLSNGPIPAHNTSY